MNTSIEDHKISIYIRNKHKITDPFDDSILPILARYKKDKNSHSINWEILRNINLIDNLPNNCLLPRDFHLYNPMLNLYKNYPSPSDLISWNKEVLFRIQRCNNCNIVVLVMFFGFDDIKPMSDYRCNNICRSQKQNNGMTYLRVRESFIKSIISFIDKEKSSKIYIKCRIIPSHIYTKLVVEKKPFFHNDKENGNIPPWMITYIMDEEFVELGVIDEDNWAYRLTNNNKKSIEITKDELMEFINYGDSTFGLFRFHKENISVYFFSYLQIENTLFNSEFIED
jgi:hypothetical protein